MSERRDKSNKKFMLLSAIGIFMVVDHHTFTAFNILGDFLPYNSFFKPMFVFISGYFNKVDNSTNLWTYFLKKVKTLLVPYIGLSLTVFAVQQLINYIKLGNEMTVLPSDYLSFVLRRIVTVGSFGAIVEPMWFVIALFSTLIIYAVLKKFLYKIWNSYIMFALFFSLQILVVYIAKTTEFEAVEYWLIPLKCLFFFPFIELGIIYRDHLEKKHTAMPATGKIALMFMLLVINMIRTVCMPVAYDIAFDSIDELSGFTSPYYITPMISAVIGILFWLTLVDFVGKQVSESRFVNFMSCNTFWIMGLHILFYNILNCILMGINNGITEISYFDVEAFRGTEWYFWGISGNAKILYVLIGVLGPLGLKWIYDRLCVLVNDKVLKLSSRPPQTARVLKITSAIGFVIISVLAISLIVILTQPKESGNEEPYYSGPADIDMNDDNSPKGNNEPATGITSEPETAPDRTDITPVYAYLSLSYENNGTADTYFTDPYAINGNGTYTITVTRSENADIDPAFDNLSYMSIRILDDESSDVDISNADITGVKVKCDGVELKVNEIGHEAFDGEKIGNYFECYDPEGSAENVYAFKDKNVIEITFTVSGATLQ